MAAPILNLDSLVDRPVVRVNGTDHELLTADILPPIDAHRLGKYGDRLSALLQKGAEPGGELSPDEEAELETLPDRMCRLVLDAPEDVHAALKPQQRMAIVNSFLSPPQPRRMVGSESADPATASTGASSSLGSPASTEATP